MKKIELLRELVAFPDDMEAEVMVRIIKTDNLDCAVSEKTVEIRSIGHFLGFPCINVSQRKIDEAQERLI